MAIATGCGGTQVTTQPATPTPDTTLPGTPTRRPVTPPPTEAPTSIVVFQVLGGSDRPVDVTYTGRDGTATSVPGASPGTWSQGGFWPVGASITLSATTDDAGNRDFSCQIRANGTHYTESAEARLDGNTIVGWACEVGPIMVESVL